MLNKWSSTNGQDDLRTSDVNEQKKLYMEGKLKYLTRGQKKTKSKRGVQDKVLRAYDEKETRSNDLEKLYRLCKRYLLQGYKCKKIATEGWLNTLEASWQLCIKYKTTRQANRINLRRILLITNPIKVGKKASHGNPH